MAATYRVTLKFIASDGSTWNEVYYQEGSSAEAASLLSSLFRSRRLALLHPTYTLQSVYAANVAGGRDTSIDVLNLPGQASTLFGPATSGDTAFCNMKSAAGTSRKLMLRGLPDTFIVKNVNTGKDAPPAFFTTPLNAFFLRLANEGYGIRSVSAPTVVGALAPRSIITVDGHTNPGLSILTLDAPGLYLVGDRIIITRASPKDLPGLNGHWPVRAVAGNLVTIPYQTTLSLSLGGGQAQCRKEVYSATQVFSAGQCKFAYYGTRRTRDFFTRSAGARRAVRLRHLV